MQHEDEKQPESDKDNGAIDLDAALGDNESLSIDEPAHPIFKWLKIVGLFVFLSVSIIFLYVLNKKEKVEVREAQASANAIQKTGHENDSFLGKVDIKDAASDLTEKDPLSDYAKPPPVRTEYEGSPQFSNKELEYTRRAAPSTMYDIDMSDDNGFVSIDIKAKRIKNPDYTLVQGEILPATLETAITSELAGQVRAIISEPVYAYTGTNVLIPAGSRLVGSYQKAGSQVQSRVFIKWDRVILPNGVSAQIDSPSSDRLGRTGQGANQRDTHFFDRFGQAILVSLISAGASTVGVGNDDDYNSLQEYRSAVSESAANTATDMLNENANIKPTLRVYQGAKLNILVAKDIDFKRSYTKMMGR